MADILSAGKAALNTASGPIKSYVVPFVIGLFVVTLVVAFVPGLKKFLSA